MEQSRSEGTELGKDKIEFIRGYTIKGLYNPQSLLKPFYTKEFGSLKDFMNCLEMEYVISENEIVINITDAEELSLVMKIINETDLCGLSNVVLKTTMDILDTLPPTDRNFSCITPLSNTTSSNDNFMKWKQQNMLVHDVVVTYENMNTILEEVITVYQKAITRFFNIKFDYQSFEKMSLSELPLLYFRISRLLTWEQATPDEMKMMFIKSNTLLKGIYIHDYKLYYCKQHYIDSPESYLFLMDNNKDGETTSYKELNKIRQYIDLRLEVLTPRKEYNRNVSFIDFYQNVLINDYINVVPHLTNLIMEWMR